ncbi:PEP-CTERM sorting domain-containing protein [Massilia sp. CCM 8734]|uniref:PEP-CTERM sorting domain-containing protein n=1 Tax=Massilia sp. CCM 8734 TaxID=2609283 RepID=UPI001AAE4346|nr:PEP-CTERM sorting domain-containing protein [Massilia sp. CCM 8734]
MSKHPSRLPARLFLAGLLLLPLSGHALTVSSSVQVRQISIEVIDLRPDDGVAPVAEFRHDAVESLVVYDVQGGAIESFRKNGYGSLEQTWTVGAAQTHTAPGTLTASSLYHGPALTDRFIHANNSYSVGFSLSPYTALRFSAVADVAASPRDAHARASSVAAFRGHLEDEQFIYSEFSVDYRAIDNEASTNLFDRTLQTGANSGKGSFFLWATASNGIYGVPPVPEPSTYAMLLAGMGLVLWRLRGAASANAYGPTQAGRLPLAGRTRA